MTLQKPLVTIVTPSYNQGSFIEETIKSVFSQDYENIEYYVIDGGSTDNTLDILKRYEKKLTWISEKDKGQTDAINKGFSKAKGDVFSWINSDDTYLPGTIKKIADFFSSNPLIGMVYGKGYHIDECGRVVNEYKTEPFNYLRLSEKCFICQPTAFFRADVFRKVGELDVSLDYSMDYDYWMRVSQKNEVVFLNDYLANSRLHKSTKTLSQRGAVHKETVQIIKKHYDHVPMNWLCAETFYFLVEKFIPSFQDIYESSLGTVHLRRFFFKKRFSQFFYLNFLIILFLFPVILFWKVLTINRCISLRDVKIMFKSFRNAVTL